MKPDPRYAQPVKGSRPRGTRLIEYYSLKLGRRVSAWSYPQFEILLSAEVESGVQSYCERPIQEGFAADLWERRSGGESFAVLSEGDTPLSWKDLPVTRISGAELASRKIWLRNWQSMLPAAIANREGVSRAQRDDVMRLIREPMPLANIERELSIGDPARLRGCIFLLLHEGALKAPCLHEEALSLATRIGPAQ
jgi:hypothetical protein